MSIGRKVKERRKELGLTQTELANRLNTTKQTIYKYENEVVTNLPSDRIEQLATALDTTPQFLMGWVEIELASTKGLTQEQIKKVNNYIEKLKGEK